ncbi:uncharacterized protein K441DRAFT_664115 [Cenococcum geophilum 1.58]|uniref:uncharacterized protein n=1 Tax=Cenococcum geophilum 1.58 TaxID=794803 RepID=UPI00358E33DE|nr:hypothetical protein K441DRAFT_664115 [Cenococcum geophilum 1.58]
MQPDELLLQGGIHSPIRRNISNWTLVSQVSKFNKPLKEDLNFLQEWLRDAKGGSDFLTKNNNVESLLYEPEYKHDLITLSQLSGRSPEQDPFFRLLGKKVLRWYHFCIGQHRRNRSRIVDEESNIVDYSESTVQRAANIVATVLSSVLPLVAILVLDRFKDTRTRIHISVGITAVFAFILALFTDARRVEIFAATATFAAVEVVFIGSVTGGKD